MTEDTSPRSKHSLQTAASLSIARQLFLCNRQSPDDPLLSVHRFPCQVLIPLLASQLHIHLGGLMTYTGPSLHDFSGHVIRGERSLQRCSSRESRGQSQSICLILQSAVSVNETMWSPAHKGTESTKAKNQPLKRNT